MMSLYLFWKSSSTRCATAGEENIILNPNFEDGVNNWTGRGCKILLHDSMGGGKIVPQSGKFFAATTERTQTWNGIQQEITGRVQRKLAYEVAAVVRIFSNNVSVSSADVRVTLWVQTPNLREQYIGVAKLVSFSPSTFQIFYLLHGFFFNIVCCNFCTLQRMILDCLSFIHSSNLWHKHYCYESLTFYKNFFLAT